MASQPAQDWYPVTLECAIAAVTEVVGAQGVAAPSIAGETRFDDIGLDSVDHALGFVVLEDLMGIELDPESAVGLQCVSDLTRIRAVSPANLGQQPTEGVDDGESGRAVCEIPNLET